MSPVISDIAHAGDVITAALALPLTAAAWPKVRRGLAYGTRCCVHLLRHRRRSERASERSRVGKSVRRGDEKEGRKQEAEAGRKKQRTGRVERLNGIKMTLPWRIASPPSDRFTNFSRAAIKPNSPENCTFHRKPLLPREISPFPLK